MAYLDSILLAQKHYAKALEPVCRKWEITRNELDILLFLHNNPGLDRAADIVTKRGIAKSHVSLSAGTLECRGLLERRCDPEDRRSVHLLLTQAARPIALDGVQAQKQFFGKIFSGVSAEEARMLEALTQRIYNNILSMEET